MRPCPSIPPSLPLILAKVTTAPNPDLASDQLPAEATAVLPSAPLGSGFIHDPAHRARTATAWQRHLSRFPCGAPDGTGLRSTLLSACTILWDEYFFGLMMSRPDEQQTRPKFIDLPC